MRVNSFNSKAIIEAQKAYASCKCAACEGPFGEAAAGACDAMRKLLAEIERGEDMYLAAHGVKP